MNLAEVEQWKGREVARLLTLVETERRYYQEMVASLPVCLAVVSREGEIQSTNRAFRQTFNLRGDEVRRRTLDQLIDSPQLLSELKQPAGAPLVVQAVERTFRASVILNRRWDEDVELEALVVLEDVTGVAGVAPVLPELPELPAMIWTADPTSIEFTIITGEEADIAHPGMTSSRIHPDDRDRIVDIYRDALATPGTHACEYRATDKHGLPAWYRDAFIVTAASQGTIAKAAGVVTDITARKAVEQIVMQANRLDAVSELAKTIAHDLNNPLMIVTGYSEELMATLDDADPRRGEMEEVLNAAHRIGAITSQLLAFTHKNTAPPEPVDVNDILTKAVEPGTIELRAPTSLRAIANPAQLTGILTAAVDRLKPAAIDVRRADLHERISEALPPGRYVEIVLTGCTGTTPLDSLLPGKDSTAPELARAHALVREWEGGIWRDGADLHIVLPAAPDEAPPAAAGEPNADTPQPEPEPSPPLMETILVVEDEGGIRALVRKILRRQNYDVLEAGTPDEALAVVTGHSGSIHLLITDMTLPQRNGRRLAEELRALLPHLKTLYVSGYTDDPSVYEVDLPAGAAFLQKPFTLGSLLKKVRDVLDQPE